MPTARGLIVRTQSGFFTVETGQGQYVCQLRGRLKQGPRLGDIAALGDWVKFTILDDGTGIIEEIEPRSRLLSRMDPRPQGEYEQIIIANPDQILFVFACTQPEPRLGMLDRYLVIAEKQNIPAVVVANKTDLTGMDKAREIFSCFEELGYPVLYVSAKTGLNVDELHKQLIGKVSALTGPSGAGKSSLLNAVQPGLGLAASHVSRATRKGRHTTVVREMFPLKEGGYVADTPGLKALAL